MFKENRVELKSKLHGRYSSYVKDYFVPLELSAKQSLGYFVVISDVQNKV